MKHFKQLSIILLSIFSIILSSQALAVNARDAALHALGKKNWVEAIKYAKKSGDKTALKVIQTAAFIDRGGGFEDITQFIAQNPEWPETKKLEKIAENAINSSTSKTKIVQWFKNREPITDKGAKYYALAAEKLIKDSTQLKRIIKQGWIYGDYTRDEQKDFLAKNAKYLDKTDHAKKIDYLLWAGSTEKAEGLLKLASDHDRHMFKEAITLIKKCICSEEHFQSLDTHAKHHSILLYSYLKLHEKDEVIDARIADLAANAPKDSDHSTEWWKLQARFARTLIKQGRYQEAYNIAKNHNALTSEDVSEAEFMAGWLALRFVNKPGAASQHFQALHKVVKQPISVSRAAYWLGRANLALGKKEEAHKWLREAASLNYTYYGQLASIELGNHTLTLPKKPKITAGHHKNITQNEIVRAAKMLLAQNLDDLAMVYVKAFMTKAPSAEEALIMMDYIRDRKGTNHIIAMAKAASYNRILLVNDAFPTKYKISNKFIEPALAYSIIRQETLFDQHAISNRNAHGLMQLLPQTACDTAKTLKMKCKPKNHLLTNTDYNITLGTKTFKDSLDANDGSYILAIIAYNAGPHKIPEWIETYGDPRKLKNHYEVIDWIEKIPYHETRNYVQRLLENLQVYRSILGQGKEMRLLKDMGVRQKPR